MSIDLADYETKTREAIKAFWGNREAARQKQIESGRVDQGERAGVTSGKNMDGFLALVKDIVHLNGLGHAKICLERRVLTLPGYFRPTKLWDMLVLNDGKLVAAVEFKSQVGPSFGNNFNNRSEEAIGTAVDLTTAYREGALGDNPRPFVGWVMLLEDCESSRTPSGTLRRISPCSRSSRARPTGSGTTSSAGSWCKSNSTPQHPCCCRRAPLPTPGNIASVPNSRACGRSSPRLPAISRRKRRVRVRRGGKGA